MKNLKKNSMLPISESNDPNNILIKDKKFLTIAMLVALVFIAITALTALIIGCVVGSAEIVFLGLFAAVISVVMIMIFVCIAHNVSRQTVAVLKIAEKFLGEPAIDDTKLSALAENAQKEKAKTSATNSGSKTIQ